MADQAASNSDGYAFRVNMSLGTSRNLSLLTWGTFLGFIAGVVASLVFSGPILTFIGVSTSSAVALFCLPLVMIALGAAIFSTLAWLSLGVNTDGNNKAQAYHGVRVILDAVSESKKGRAMSSRSKDNDLASTPSFRYEDQSSGAPKSASTAVAKIPDVTFVLKLAIARFGRGAIGGAILGAAGALAAGWFFSGAVLGFAGLSTTATIVALAYPVVLLAVGLLVGVALGGLCGWGIGKIAAWWQGSDALRPTWRNAFSQVRLTQIETNPNNSKAADLTVSAYGFNWDGQGKLELKTRVGYASSAAAAEETSVDEERNGRLLES